MAAVGETYGYMESCHPAADRQVFRRAFFLESLESVFKDNALRVISMSWDLGRLKGTALDCSNANRMAVMTRTDMALQDAKKSMERALAAQEAKARRK